MSEDQSSIRDHINSELKRVQIQNHPNFPAWYDGLKPHTRQVVDFILEEDVTPALILLADDAPEDEWKEYLFLRTIGGGNPDPEVQPALTNFCLREILFHVEGFANPLTDP
ncbi:MAG: hypothetical protein ACM3XO_10755 [Bacteroidota bacterium]|jgi:hypothetical protein